MGLSRKEMNSPLGRLQLVADEQGLVAILWENDDPKRVKLEPTNESAENPVLIEAERQLNEYFAGTRTTFTLPLSFQGTPFQKKIWDAMLAIPYGKTCSYADLAREIGKPNATRAVGAAIGRNPISIIGPCHRVIGSSGALTGFAGGLDAKRFLLQLESAPHDQADRDGIRKEHVAA